MGLQQVLRGFKPSGFRVKQFLRIPKGFVRIEGFSRGASRGIKGLKGFEGFPGSFGGLLRSFRWV